MTNYIPYPFYYDNVPIDISSAFKNEKPAGKHGFLRAEGTKFIFADGTEARFWGTNFNGGANFPSHEYAEMIAGRLSKIGINLVRLHQLDAEWNTPNIFAFSKGKRLSDTLEFDKESMDRLDYLIYCLKREGIYLYMDMYTYRKFKSGDGVENAHLLNDSAKPYGNYSRKLIELQKDLCRKLWTHTNPYTGLKYCDDPVFVLAEITNESDLFGKHVDKYIEPYVSEFNEMLDTWLKDKNIPKTSADFSIEDLENETLIDFRIELTEKYYKELMQCMRECGVKIPIAGTNWTRSPSLVKTQQVTDYIDSHAYHYDWAWGEFEHHCMNESISMQKGSYLTQCALGVPNDMPVYISEWDMPWPNEYRAESPIYSAAIAMLQGWSGMAIHTYSYTTALKDMNILGKEISAPKVGNIPYREGVFSAWNDPAKFGLFYHAALITRRGDVSRAKKEISIRPLSKTQFDWDTANALIEQSRIVSRFDKGKSSTLYASDLKPADEIVSDTGELYINRAKNIGYVNTPKTKCAYGFLGRNDAIELSGVKINGITDFAVVAMSSLTDDDISCSDNILLTTVGRAENSGSEFKNSLMTKLGTAPITVEVIEAEIEIETKHDGLIIWAVSAEGLYIGTVPSKYEDGKLKFKTGDVSQSMYYLIVKE